MTARYLLGLDLGGGGVRALLVDVDTAITQCAFRPGRPQSPPDLPTASEFDPEAIWGEFAAATREALARSGAAPSEVVGVAATSMRHASALLDAGGNIILLTSNRDARGMGALLGLSEDDAAEIHRRTGTWPGAIHPLGRLLWLASERPELWERAAVHLSLSDWIAQRLCGGIATDASQAGETLLFDLVRGAWATDVAERFGIPTQLLPPVRPAGERLGVLSAEAALHLGLPPGLPVGVGGGDTQCGLLGAGVLAPGEIGLVAGTTAPIQQVQERALLDPSAALWAGHHVVPERWVLESNAGGVGEALAWIAGLLDPGAPYPVLGLLAEAEGSLPGAAGMFSTFGADVMNARNMAFPIGDLTLSQLSASDDPQRRRHLARAVIEGIAFALRANIEQIEAVSATPRASVRIAGGLSRNAFFTQLVSDVLDRPLAVAATPEATALGAAICAGVAGSVFDSLAEGAEHLARVSRHCTPDPDRSRSYDPLFAGWSAVRTARAPATAPAMGIAIQGLASASSAPDAAAASPYRPRILVTAVMDKTGLADLRRIGEVEYASFKDAMRLLTGRALVEAVRGFDVLVTEVDVIDGAALVDARDLRVIAVCRGDAVNVDLAACSELGIPVVNTPGRNADAVADLALAYLLMLARHLPQATVFLHEPGGEAGDMGRMGRAFASLQGRELWNKTVGLVGLGAVGRKVVERLRPFGARCIVHDPYLDPDRIRLAGAEPVTLETLLETSDFVSLHAAVSDASRGLIGRDELAHMRPSAFLVNTARAALVDEAALVEALRSGQIAGAALDVFATEPPASDDPLLLLDNVIATPHVAGNTADVAAHQGRIVAGELQRLCRGERPLHALNPDVLESFRFDVPRRQPDAELAARLRESTGAAVTDLENKTKREKDGVSPPPDRKAAPREDAPVEAVAPTLSEGAGVRGVMEEILRSFVERIVADRSLGDFARGQDVMLHFHLSDLGTDFHFGFRDDAVFGAMGAPESAAGVQLKMRADLLDGMFTGRSNAMQAAMQGELSFSGDTAKAMTLTQIQADLERLYREARAAVGDPGDLTAIAEPSGAPVAAPSPAFDDLRSHLVDVVRELYAAQLITATGGNVSARLPDAPDEAWITPGQLFKGDLQPERLVRIGMDGRALDAGAGSPSSEALMHTAVLKARPEAAAVIHCHATHATILANSGLPFLPISTEAAFFANIGRIPFVMPGTQELADAIVAAMGDGWAVLMQNHGLLVAGRTLRRAADMAEIIERTAQVILGCRAVGVEPPVLPPEVVETLSQVGDLLA